MKSCCHNITYNQKKENKYTKISSLSTYKKFKYYLEMISAAFLIDPISVIMSPVFVEEPSVSLPKRQPVEWPLTSLAR